jgi:hypothetical protein
LNRQAALQRLLDYLESRGYQFDLPRQQAISALQSSIVPRKSGTFRKGEPGNWREHFTPANITAFKESTGDLLARLGYETGDDW